MSDIKPFEVESWVEYTTDTQLVKIRKFKEDGTKIGMILVVDDNELYQLAEGMEYPRMRLVRGGPYGD